MSNKEIQDLMGKINRLDEFNKALESIDSLKDASAWKIDFCIQLDVKKTHNYCQKKIGIFIFTAPSLHDLGSSRKYYFKILILLNNTLLLGMIKPFH